MKPYFRRFEASILGIICCRVVYFIPLFKKFYESHNFSAENDEKKNFESTRESSDPRHFLLHYLLFALKSLRINHEGFLSQGYERCSLFFSL